MQISGKQIGLPAGVSVQGYENLERLYPNGEYQTIEKIMKCRIEHNKRKTLNAAFVEKVNPVIKHGFLKIKEYSWAIQVYENAMVVELKKQG